MIAAFALLLACQLAGEVVVRLAGLPVPGALVGMVLLAAGLVWRGRVSDGLAQTSSGLLNNMMLLLAPAVVGLVEHADRIRAQWLPFVVACVAGAIITLVVTAVVLQWLLRRSGLSTGSAP